MRRREFVLLALVSPLPACHPIATRDSLPGITLRIDVTGAEAMLAALEQKSITDADLDRLLQVRGVQAMVDNTTKYIPHDTRAVFRTAMRNFVATAYEKGFAGMGPPLYFVGYEMAKAIDREHGPARISGYFGRHRGVLRRLHRNLPARAAQIARFTPRRARR